jgi:hypothetical protein
MKNERTTDRSSPKSAVTRSTMNLPQRRQPGEGGTNDRRIKLADLLRANVFIRRNVVGQRPAWTGRAAAAGARADFFWCAGQSFPFVILIRERNVDREREASLTRPKTPAVPSLPPGVFPLFARHRLLTPPANFTKLPSERLVIRTQFVHASANPAGQTGPLS